MTAMYANDVLAIVRPAVAIALLWANVAWAQSQQQPVQGVRTNVTEQSESNPNTINTRESTRSEPAAEFEDKPGAVRGMTLRLSTGVGYDANVFRTEGNTRDDFFWSLRPAASLNGGFSKHSYRLGYEGDYARYFDFSTEDFYDHRFLATHAWI
jgi:hypothetical protein